MIVVGGWPGRQVIGLNGRFGVRVSELASGSTDPNPFLNNFDVGDDPATEMAVVVTSLPASGTVTLADDGDFLHTGAADGAYHTLGSVYSWAPGGPLVQHATPEDILSTFGSGASAAASITGAGDIASRQAFGLATVQAGGGVAVISSPGSVLSARAIGTPSSVAADTASASVSGAGGIASAAAFGLPTISSKSAQDMWPEPVSVAEAKTAARVDLDITAMDDEIQSLITAARIEAEHITRRIYRRRQITFERSGWPTSSEPFGVCDASSCEISYYSADGNWTPLDASEFKFAVVSNRTYLAPAIGRTWPVLGALPVGMPVRITITGGPASRDEVPETVKRYIKAHVSAWLKNPGAIASASLVGNPLYDGLLDSKRLWH